MLVAALIAMHLAQQPWTNTTPDGRKVTLYAISDAKTFWKPDGTPFNPHIDPNSFLVSKRPTGTQRYLTAIVRFDTPAHGPWPTVSLSVLGTQLSDSRIGPEGELSIPPRNSGAVEAMGGGLVASDQVSGDLTVVCATGAWRNVGTYDLKKHRSTGLAFVPIITSKKQQSTDINGTPIANDFYYSIGVKVTAPARFVKPNEVRRIDAFSDKHVELEGGGSIHDPRTPTKLEYFFGTGEPAMGQPRVTPRYITLQTRPTSIIVFRGVKLKPSG